MKAAVISLEGKSSLRIVEAMGKYFDSVESINIKQLEVNLNHKKPRVLWKWNDLPEYDCVYIRGSFRYAPLLRCICSYLSGKAYIPILPSTFTIGHDKVLTHLTLMKEGIPIPETYLSSSAKAAKPYLKSTQYPVVMKLPSGTQGKGVMFADSYSSASSLLDMLDALKVPFLIQQYVECDGRDLRCIVAGDKVIATMERTAQDGEKRSNIHVGASAKNAIIDEATELVALASARVVGADVCGIDIVHDGEEPLVLEVNLSPGIIGIENATNVNVADAIAQYLATQTEDFLAKKDVLRL